MLVGPRDRKKPVELIDYRWHLTKLQATTAIYIFHKILKFKGKIYESQFHISLQEYQS